MIERPHIERLLENTGPLMLVHKGVINNITAVAVYKTIAELHRSLVVIVSVFNSLRGRRILLRAGCCHRDGEN